MMDESLKKISFEFAENIAAEFERGYHEYTAFPCEITRQGQEMIEDFIRRAILVDRKRCWGPGCLNQLAEECHLANERWWRDPRSGDPIERNKGELLMLIVSELAEAMEGERKNLMDDKLPHRRAAEVELVDALIRIFDYAGGFGYDLDGAFTEKMAFNAARADHTHEARLKEGGKQW